MNSPYLVELSGLNDMTWHMPAQCFVQSWHSMTSFGGDLTRSSLNEYSLGMSSGISQWHLVQKAPWKAPCSVLGPGLQRCAALIFGKSTDGREIWVLVLELLFPTMKTSTFSTVKTREVPV